MEKNEQPGKSVSPNEKHYSDFEPAVVPISGDGGITPGFAAVGPGPSPSMDPTIFVCLAGPCRHYWHVVTDFPSGNPDSTWKDLGVAKPRQHSHSCLVQAGMEFDMTEDSVYECNRWDPLDPEDAENAARARRRELYQIRLNKADTDEETT